MAQNKLWLILIISIFIFTGCINKPEKDGKNTATGSGRNAGKISFKYDPRAPKEYLRIKKGQGEGEPCEVFVGDIKIGMLAFGTIVQKIGEEKGLYKIRYANSDGEFYGYIKYSDAETTTRQREKVVIQVGDDAEPKMYTIQQVEEQLNIILKVPYKLKVVQESPEVKTEKIFASAGTPDGYDDLKILSKFKNDPQAFVYAAKIYSELEKLYSKSPQDYQQVINLYAKALQSYKEKNFRFFEDYIEQAKKKREYYIKSF